MDRTHVAFYRIDRQPVEVIRRNAFVFNPKGRFPFIQKLCFWVLDKIKAHYTELSYDYERTELNLNNVVDAVMANLVSVNLITKKEAKYIVLGHDWTKKLIDEYNTPEFRVFSIPKSYQAPIASGGVMQPQFFMGMKIITVPWIDGLFVLPSLEGDDE